MSLTAPIPLSPAAPWRTWLLRALAVALTLAMLLYGLAAIDAGIVNYRGAGNAEIAAKRVAMQRAAEAGQTVGDTREIAAHSSIMLALLSRISSPTYAYGKNGLSEPLIHYATMPKANGIVLSVHNVLGGTCMLFGALQFWPAFRRRFPLWHRAFGAIYLLAAQAAMVASMVYLVRTPIADIYDQLTFYVGLWGLAIGVTVSLWMAIYSMWRKQIAQHQAWMCLNYGMLLTAPIQRYGWLAFGAAAPELRQLEANYAVTGVLVPLCVMIGYGLFTLNRWAQDGRSAKSMAKVAQAFTGQARLGRTLALLGLPVLLAAGASTVQHYMLNPGLGQAANAATLIPAGVIQMEDAVIAGHAPTRTLFALATLLGLLGGARLLWTAFATQQAAARIMDAGAWALAAGGAVVGAVLVHWGVQMGLPSFATVSGGALHVFGGTMTLLFATLLAWALRRRQAAWAKEWGVFVIAGLVATPSFYWALPALGAMGFDAQFVQTGHVFRLASYGQWMLLIGAFVYAIYSEATHSKLAR